MRIADLEDQLAKVRPQAEQIKKERDNLRERLATATLANLDELSIEESKLKAREDMLGAKTHQIKTLIEELKFKEQKAAGDAELSRKNELYEYLGSHPPRCRFCGRRDKMRVAKDCYGKPTSIQVTTYNEDYGLRTLGVQWFVLFQCLNHPCLGDQLGQAVRPDEPRTFVDGQVDDEFPVLKDKGAPKK